MDLNDKTVLVTGSSRNIGRSIAVRMAEHGANVGVTARTDGSGCEKTASLIADTTGDCTISLGDLAEPDDIRGIVADVEREFGAIDVLVNNATIRPPGSTLDVSLEEWQTVHETNLRGQFLLAQQVLPGMVQRGSGRILSILGVSQFTGQPTKPHVIANKAGIIGLTRALAAEFGRDGITVNALVLGLIDTDRDVENYDDWESTFRRHRQATALRRVGTPQDVANVCCFFASDYSSYVTGQLLHVNGGLFPTTNIIDASD